MTTPEVELVSLVGVFDPNRVERMAGLGPPEISSIEERLGETLTLGQATSTRGSGARLVISRWQLDMLLLPDRIEVRSEAASFTKEVAERIGEFFDSVTAQSGQMPWTRVGFNFILRAESQDSAISRVNAKIFREDLGAALGNHDIIGGAAWVWLDIDGDTLWLKLQPHRDSLDTKRIIVNANFTDELGDEAEFPDSTTIAEGLLKHWGQLDAVLQAFAS